MGFRRNRLEGKTRVVGHDATRPRKAPIIYRSNHDLYGQGRLIRMDQEITDADPLAVSHELYFTAVGWVNQDKSRSYLQGYEPAGEPMLAQETF